MTSHEAARILLESPDVPLVFPTRGGLVEVTGFFNSNSFDLETYENDLGEKIRARHVRAEHEAYI